MHLYIALAIAGAVFAAGTAPESARGAIDEAVFGRLAELGIRPAPLSSDEVFVRRVYLDAIGTLPAPEEVRTFLSDPASDKRAKLIDRLLEREEFAEYWAMKWGDILRVKAEYPINLWPNAAQAYHRWIRDAIRENVPYDCFARELLTSSGSNFRVPPVNFYRAVQSREPEAIARAVALTFLGVRVEKWPEGAWSGLPKFFARISYKSTAEWKEEIVSFDPEKPPPAGGEPPRRAELPGGAALDLPPDRDPREVFADWLCAPGNPWFARAIANRVWHWLLGRGVVHEPDDFRPDNPPRNPALLDALERELVGARFDLRSLYRAVLNSAAYQLSSVPASDRSEAEDEFACYRLRRLEAEVLIDALNQVTGTSEKYSSAVPEPFTFVPETERAISLPDPSVTSPFLELFGRSPRDTGYELERTNRLTAAQRLHLLNSSHIQRKLEGGAKLRALLSSGWGDRRIVEELYLLILSRFPTREELQAVAEYARSGGNRRREVYVDLAWALFNSAEFLYRH
ncbi:MAG: DUF1553 domain-containing protein [Planctomycetota bacterium]